jgi:hypothetical protein
MNAKRKYVVYYVMRSKNEVLCVAAGRLAAERSVGKNRYISSLSHVHSNRQPDNKNSKNCSTVFCII